VPSFDAAWPELDRTLRAALAGRGVAAQDLDDVVQETALRVYASWSRLEHDRPLAPFVVTVGLNVWRDQLRQRRRSPGTVGPVPDQADRVDVEQVVCARAQLTAVATVLRRLDGSDRRLLLAGEEFEDGAAPLSGAQRVKRLRLRRWLADNAGRWVGGAVPWWQRSGTLADLATRCACGAVAVGVLAGPVAVPAAIAAPPVTAAARAAGAHPSAAARPARRAAKPVATAETTRRAAAPKQPRRHTPRRPAATTVCAPARQPVGSTRGGASIGSGGIYQQGPDGQPQPVLTTPPSSVDSGSGCVHTG
jgi:DNA-directed RNA polymerase specialized sigma24 family protein